MVETYIRETGISIVIEDPLWFSNTANSPAVFQREMESYSHSITADGGFESASFIVSVNSMQVDDWLRNGIGRHVVVYGPNAQVIWEGFVNIVSIGMGTLSASRGPLFDIGNRVSIVYTPIIDAEVDPMVTGSATETPITEDTDSQDRYGIIEKVISGGQLLDDGTTDEAEELRDLYLAEFALPFTDENINTTSQAVPKMTVECRGYKDWLGAYVYNEYAVSTVTLDTKIIEVLDDDPNGIFSTDQSKIDANAQLTNRLDDKNRFANAVISEIVSLGDASDNRWLFSVKENNVCYYEAAPTEVEFTHMLSTTLVAASSTGAVIKPWDMRPAVLIEISDFLTGVSFAGGIRKDPRIMFAETVTYTAPNGLSITGSRMTTFAQRLKQLGASG